MKIGCVEGIAALARATTSAEAAAAYAGEQLTFGPDYLIPKPFDPRLMGVVASAVAKAAMESGVAARPVDDVAAYKAQLDQSVFRSAFVMRPVFEAAASAQRRIVFAEGEDERVLRAAQAIMEETTDIPILIGRPDVIETRVARAGLTIDPGVNVEIVNPENDPRYRDYWETYHELMARRGVARDIARAIMRTNTTAIAAVMVHRGEADSLICGTFGQFLWHLRYVSEVLGRDALHPVGAMSLILLDAGPLFVADTHVHAEPTPAQVAETVEACARHVRRFGIAPKVALCSGSQFGDLDSRSGRTMRGALEILDSRRPSFEYEGEMNWTRRSTRSCAAASWTTAASTGRRTSWSSRRRTRRGRRATWLKARAGGLEVGPILMGLGNKAHIVTPSITARGLLNMAALAGTPVALYE